MQNVKKFEASNFCKLTITKILYPNLAQNSSITIEIGLPQNYNGHLVLVPKGANWTDLAEYVQAEIFALEENEPIV